MVYTGKKLQNISFPLGGIGTGSIGLAGNGLLCDWEIRNRPNKGSYNDYCHFAVKAEYPDGRVVTKVLMGDTTHNLTGNYEPGWYLGFGFGPERKTLCGMPHFRKVRFDGKFPIATLTFKDEDFPGTVVLKAFNPFIPLEADNSSIPAAFFDITVKSREKDVVYTVVFSVCNKMECGSNRKVENGDYTMITMRPYGIDDRQTDYFDMTVGVDEKDGICQQYWYRGRWEDCLNTFWHEFNSGDLCDRTYEHPATSDKCTVGAKKVPDSKGCCRFRFILSWNAPNNYNYWDPYKDKDGKDVSWKNYYALLWKDSAASCLYAFEHWNLLERKTREFCRLLHSSTADKAILDAVSSTLSVLKSPTVFRLEDGSFYGFEGCLQTAGSCEGTCTHVWSYAYALCFLFPELEQSIRDMELRFDTDENGNLQFRTKLPLGRGRGEFHPCIDGQMANIVKVYRDWKISGNTAWLKSNWETIKKWLEYAWSEHNPNEWDRNHDGVAEGRQHYTLDMELFGPSAWLQGLYSAALKAASQMAEFLGDHEKAEEYVSLFENAYRFTKEHLFNGEYFIHQIDLTQKEYTDRFQCPEYWNEEKNELKYQIGDGCAIDQMLGQWHATVSGLGDIFDPKQRQAALSAVLRYNYKENMRGHTNPWRSYALNDEGGMILCTYPEGSIKPIIPMPYCEECWTGSEYAFAGLLISENLIEDAVRVVQTARRRFNGENRNPWNEFECGSNYARSMSAFAMLPLLSGFEFDLPRRHIGFTPKSSGDFRCFWSLGTGWGEYCRQASRSHIRLSCGVLELESVRLGNIGKVKTVCADGKQLAFMQCGDVLHFERTTITKELCIEE